MREVGQFDRLEELLTIGHWSIEFSESTPDQHLCLVASKINQTSAMASMETNTEDLSRTSLNGTHDNSTSKPVDPPNAATTTPTPRFAGPQVDFTRNPPPNIPSPPFIHVEGVPNFRDLGGYACPPPPGYPSTSQYRVRPNILYRCATLAQITIQGSDTLTQDLNIGSLYDLRSTPETSRVGAIPEIPGLFQHRTPVYETEDYSPQVLAKKYKWYTSPAETPYTYEDRATGDQRTIYYSPGFVDAYRDIATHAARAPEAAATNAEGVETPAVKEGAYRTILQRILAEVRPHDTQAANDLSQSVSNSSTTSYDAFAPKQEKHGPLIFHCTAGKDRTGVLAAVILTLCGVPEDVVCWEYAITEPGLGGWREEIVARMTGGGSHIGAGSKEKIPTQSPAQGQTTAEPQPADRKAEESNARVLSGGGPNTSNPMTRAEALRICGSRSGNLRVFMREVLEKELGGVERYLTGLCGFSGEEVRMLREGLVERCEGGVRGWGKMIVPGWEEEMGAEEH